MASELPNFDDAEIAEREREQCLQLQRERKEPTLDDDGIDKPLSDIGIANTKNTIRRPSKKDL